MKKSRLCLVLALCLGFIFTMLITKPIKNVNADSDYCWVGLNGSTMYLASDETAEIKAARGNKYEKSNGFLAEFSQDDTIKKVIVQDKISFEGDQAECLFLDFYGLKEIEGIENIDVSQATSISSMFSQCKALTSIDISSFDTSNVTNITNLFDGSTKLKYINMGVDFSKVNSASNVISSCSDLENIYGPKNLNPLLILPSNGNWYLTNGTLTNIMNKSANSIHYTRNFKKVESASELISCLSSYTLGYIVLKNDITTSSKMYIYEGKDITIDFKGFSIDGNNSASFLNFGKLTLIDSSNSTSSFDWTLDNGKWIKNVSDENPYTTKGSYITNMNGFYNVPGKNLGGAIFNTSELIIDGIDFIGNEASMGGAIYNNETGTLKLSNSEIKGNIADIGAGICNTNSTEIYNSEISYNTANEVAGIFSKNNLKLSDTKVINNTTNDENHEYPSAGLYTYSKTEGTGLLTLDGSIIIRDNKTLDNDANLCLMGYMSLDSSNLGENSSIGITKLNSSDEVVGGTFLSNCNEDSKSIFISDSPAYGVFYNSNTLKIEHVHSPKLISAIFPSCTESGVSQYYECIYCNKYFTSSECTTEITDLASWKLAAGKLNALGHSTSKVSGVAPTCTEAGFKDAYLCSNCNKYFEDQNAETLIGDSNAYNTWKLNGGKLNALGHNTSKVSGVAPACTEAGYEDAYLCSTCNKYFEDQNAETLIGDSNAYNTWKLNGGKLNALGHSVTLVAGKESSPKENGFKDAYLCSNCNKYFEDEECTTLIGDETAYENWILNEGMIPKSGLTGGAIAGIAVGSVVGVSIISYACMFVIWLKKKKGFKFLFKSFEWILKLFK